MIPILNVAGLRIVRGDSAILRGVDWTVLPGEHWAMLGANGSGKTSLLKALTGYMPPTAGRIEALGRVYGESDWRDLRLKVGVVTNAFAASIPPGETALDTVTSGKFAQLDLWARISRSDRIAARRLLRFVGLSSMAEREWAFLSQGERQRVLIARALMGRPRLLILDEPCAGLDPVAREKFLQFLSRLARPRPRVSKAHGTPSIVMVTHHAEEILPHISHVLLLKSGRVIASGRRRSVLTSRNLSATFGYRLKITSIRGRYRMDFMPGGSARAHL